MLALTAAMTREDWTVAIIDARTIVSVDTPEMMNVRHEPAREQKPKRPRKSSATQEKKAMI